MTNADLRATFNKDAKKYQTYRPHYPEALLDKLVAQTQLVSGAHLLEIGPGTGQATLPLARRGYNITAVELGADLANEARRVLKKYTNVTVITGAFEDVALPVASFDLVYAATALHWVWPDVKFAKPFQLLKPGGYLAVIHTVHVSDGKGDAFFAASRPLYRKHAVGGASAANDFDANLPKIGALQPHKIDEALFELQSFDAFPLKITYTSADYVGLISTYSPVIALPTAERTAFLESIKKLADTQFGGRVERDFAMTLTVAKKRG